MFAIYVGNHAAGLTVPVVTTAANKGVLLALVAMAQTLPILTGGLDLSVGMVFVLTNCVASAIVVGSPLQTALGIVVVLGVGALAGLINGCIVVYGRLQPIIATLATGAIYYGLALWLRPMPGRRRHCRPCRPHDRTVLERVPTSLVLLWPSCCSSGCRFAARSLARGCYAIGSPEGAAYMSGVPIGRIKLAAYTLAGLLAAIAGLLLTFVTYSGEASASIGGPTR